MRQSRQHVWRIDDLGDFAMLTTGVEVHHEGLLRLTIEFNIDRGGFVLELASPPLWMFAAEPGKHNLAPLIYSQVVIPVADYERGDIDAYLDALLAIHFERLGLLDTGW